MGMGYDYSAFGEQDTELSLAGKYYKIPFMINLSTQIPLSFNHLDNEGLLVNRYYLYEFSTSLSSGYSFNIKKQNLKIGTSLKWYQEKFLNENISSLITDIGFIAPISIPWLNFLPTKTEQISLSASLLNFGGVLSNSKSYSNLIKNNLYLPSSIIFGFNFAPVWLKNYKIEFATSLKLYPFEPSIESTLEYSAGGRMIFFNILYIRSSINKNFYFWDLNIGIGIEYIFSYVYTLQINYNIKPITGFGISHQADIKFSFNYENTIDKINQQKNEYSEIQNNITQDVTTILNNALNEYKLEFGTYPKILTELLPLLKLKYNLNVIPQPSNGYLDYDFYLGKVFIKDNNTNVSYQDVIYLKDKTRILATIITTENNEILIKTNIGERSILKSNIAYIINLKIDLLNSEILKIIQSYIDEFKIAYNQYPKSIEELKQYLKTKLILNIPQPSHGILEYDANTGNVTLK